MNEPTGWIRYEIRVRGLLSETLLGAFPRLPRGHTERRPCLRPLTYQVALYGVLAQLRALGALNYSIYGVHAHLTKTKE